MTIKITFVTLLFPLLISCKKDERLQEKPISTINTPNSLEDLEEMLDYSPVINLAPGLGDVSADNYQLDSNFWKTLPDKERNAYIWAADIFNGQGHVKEWNGPYEQCFYANVILNALENIPETSQNNKRRDNIIGAALFIRATALFNLSQLFAPCYDSVTAADDLGIPLRLSDNVLERSVRASVKQTYEQILKDALDARRLVTARMDISHPNRVSEPAVLALLSRIFLSMRNYERAGVYADSCLQFRSELLDYNFLKEQYFPFKTINPEIVFYSEVSNATVLMAMVNKFVFVDSTLYQSYDTNDLRRTLFYTIASNGQPVIRSSYTGLLLPFAGIALDEVMLTRAECKARMGRAREALVDLNYLLRNRYKHGSFREFTDSSIPQALEIILEERRKELPFRNLRWTDLRRLNKENYNIELQRRVQNVTYLLPPKHIRYVLPIPPDVITFSDMPQNPR